MPRTTNPAAVLRMLDSLGAERERLQARLAQIEEVFGRVGAAPAAGAAPKRGRGRPRKEWLAAEAGEAVGRGRAGGRAGGRGRGRGGRRKRRRFEVSGDRSVLEFVRQSGKPNAAEVNQHWKAEGRGGKADNALSKLVSDGKLKRVEGREGERGGRYAVA